MSRHNCIPPADILSKTVSNAATHFADRSSHQTPPKSLSFAGRDRRSRLLAGNLRFRGGSPETRSPYLPFCAGLLFDFRRGRDGAQSAVAGFLCQRPLSAMSCRQLSESRSTLTGSEVGPQPGLAPQRVYEREGLPTLRPSGSIQWPSRNGLVLEETIRVGNVSRQSSWWRWPG